MRDSHAASDVGPMSSVSKVLPMAKKKAAKKKATKRKPAKKKAAKPKPAKKATEEQADPEKLHSGPPGIETR